MPCSAEAAVERSEGEIRGKEEAKREREREKESERKGGWTVSARAGKGRNPRVVHARILRLSSKIEASLADEVESRDSSQDAPSLLA